MSNNKRIPCNVRHHYNYKDQTIGLAVISPKTGNELFFDHTHWQVVPRALADRIRAGDARDGTASFTRDELVQLVELHKGIKSTTSGYRPTTTHGRGWVNR